MKFMTEMIRQTHAHTHTCWGMLAEATRISHNGNTKTFAQTFLFAVSVCCVCSYLKYFSSFVTFCFSSFFWPAETDAAIVGHGQTQTQTAAERTERRINANNKYNFIKK